MRNAIARKDLMKGSLRKPFAPKRLQMSLQVGISRSKEASVLNWEQPEATPMGRKHLTMLLFLMKVPKRFRLHSRILTLMKFSSNNWKNSKKRKSSRTFSIQPGATNLLTPVVVLVPRIQKLLSSSSQPPKRKTGEKKRRGRRRDSRSRNRN
jgi:hypothetical protein